MAHSHKHISRCTLALSHCSQLAWRAAATSARRGLREGQRIVALVTSSSPAPGVSDVTSGSPPPFHFAPLPAPASADQIAGGGGGGSGEGGAEAGGGGEGRKEEVGEWR
ncbi:unnamed protein product [Closterium sp. NIES-64]|nr:unnamed protein product [Closterium sp. NIES-64]